MRLIGEALPHGELSFFDVNAYAACNQHARHLYHPKGWMLSAESDETELIDLAKEIDLETRRKIELAAEDIVMQYETSQGRECERVGHLKIGFDIRSLAPADPETGYLDPVTGVRRIEVKGRKKDQPIRLTTNEWYRATQLGDSYWLYVVWDPLENRDAEPIRIQNPAQELDHVKREVVAARFFEILASAIGEVGQKEAI
jgi:hypothetical protein